MSNSLFLAFSPFLFTKKYSPAQVHEYLKLLLKCKHTSLRIRKTIAERGSRGTYKTGNKKVSLKLLTRSLIIRSLHTSDLNLPVHTST